MTSVTKSIRCDFHRTELKRDQMPSLAARITSWFG
jgi:hypothetical protein